MTIRRNSLLLVLCAAISGLTLFGQGFTASVLGTVTDNSGAVAPGAAVTVTNIDTGQQTVVKTDDGGNYTAPQLPPGNYSVKVELQGFKRSTSDQVILQVDQRQRLDFKLELGQISEQVTVSAEASQIQTENATVGTAVTHAQTTELPLNGRNFLQLNLLVPGSAPTLKGSNLSGEGGSIEVHGLRENSNYFWIDGMDNTTQAIGELVINPPQFTIDEFRVMSPTYDAEFGRTAGAQVNVITRSGGNAYHGDVYFFLRNSVFDAKNFFDPAGRIPAYRRGQFGGDVGGKIVKDKTFFFASWEGLNYAQGESASAIVPTTQEVQGNFSGLATTIKNPQTGIPFMGNIIPASQMNPIGARIAAYYPAPDSGTNTLLSSPTGTDSDDVTVLKIDQVITQKNRFDFRVAFEDINYNQPISQYNTYTTIPGFGLIENANHNYTTGITDTYIFSPTLVAETRVGWNRFEFHYLQYYNNVNEECGVLGFTNVPSCSLPRDWGFPEVSLSGLYSSLGSSYPQFGPFDTTFVAPTFTKIIGSHSLKFGGDFHRFFSNYIQDSNVRGTFTFNGSYSGNPLSDLLLGLPNQATLTEYRNLDSEYMTIFKEFTGFVQDDWRITPRLALTVGLRYEYMTPATDGRNQLSNFDPTTGQMLVAGQNGVGSELYRADPREFAPRVGFAWNPRGAGKWAVRGGYGVFYELTMFNQVTSLRSNLPLSTNVTVLGNGSTTTLSDIFNATQAPSNPSVAGFPCYTSTCSPLSQDFKAGRVQQYSIGVQRELVPNLLLDVGYVGTYGDHLYGTLNINQPPPGPGVVQSRRPYSQYANVSITAPAFSSEYNGLEVRLERRLAKGMSFLMAYTFSYADDNSSASGGTNTPQYWANLADNWGASSYDNRQRLVFSYLYELPFGRSRAFLSHLNRVGEVLLGGWQLNGILTLQSGRPFTAVLATDNSNTGALADWPNVVGNPFQSSATCQTRTPTCWANPAAFAAAPQYTFGNEVRNSLVGPNDKELDFALDKSIRFGENYRVEFRAEAFNLTNRVNFDNPTNTLTASFGKITTAEASRQIQLALRFVF